MNKVMSSQYACFKVDLPKRLKEYSMHWGEPNGPPGDWRAGAPIGNGNFGAMIYGYPDNLSLALGKTDLWNLPPNAHSSFRGDQFAEVRDVFLNNDRHKFASLCDEPDPEKGHATTAGMLRFHFFDNSRFSKATLTNDISCGIATMKFYPQGFMTGLHTWGQVSIEMLVSHQYQVLALNAIPSDFYTGYQHNPGTRRNYPPEIPPLGEVFWELSRTKSLYTPAPDVEIINDIAVMRQKLQGGESYVIAFKNVNAENHLSTLHHRIGGTIDIEKTEPFTCYVTIVSSSESDDPVKTALERVNKAVNAGHQVIRKAHIKWWREYYQRGYILLSDREAERTYYTSLYICGSIISPEYQSPGLQGCWHKEHVPAWLGDYHTNVNLQAVYWGLFANNRVDMTLPLLDIIERIAVQAKEDTKNYFKMRGMRLPHAGSADGFELTNGDWAVSLGASIGGSGWIADLLWQIFAYTQNMELLRKRIYPLLKDIAIFYENYLIENPETGTYELYPSMFYEALSPRFESWGRNSLYELTTVKMGLSAACRAADTLEVDVADVTRWQSIMNKMQEFPKNKAAEWIAYPDRDLLNSRSHQFLLAPVFPGEMVSKWHGSEEDKHSAMVTAQKAFKYQTLTGKPWCGGQGLREIIRMGYSGEALKHYRYSQAGTSDNEFNNTENFLVHGWHICHMQADHAPGMSSVLSDMMLLQTGDILRILPDFPEDQSVAFFSLRAPGGFLITAEKRECLLDYVVIESLTGKAIKLATPWPGESWNVLESGKLYVKGCADIIEFVTKEDMVYIIERQGIPYKDIPSLKI
jgi:glycosyl hydrolase family 95/glycosyl hydrolase family 65